MDTRLLLQWITSVHTRPCFKRLITSVQGCSPRTPDCCCNGLLMSNAVRTPDCCYNELLMSNAVRTLDCCYNELLMSNAVRTPDCCYNELLMSNAVRTPDLFARDCYSVKQSAILPSAARMSSSSDVSHFSLVDEGLTPRPILGGTDIVAQTSTSFSPPGKNR